MSGGMDGAMHTVFWAVNANWNDHGWNVEANSVTNPNKWNDGNHVVSRYPFLSPPFMGGVLLNTPLRHPPALEKEFSEAAVASYIGMLEHGNSHKLRMKMPQP